jgi:hypothetical protein
MEQEQEQENRPPNNERQNDCCYRCCEFYVDFYESNFCYLIRILVCVFGIASFIYALKRNNNLI